MKEAMFYKKMEEDSVICELCPHHCRIKNGFHGICKVRKNVRGVLYTENYSKISSWAMDPIEKKPLYHFYPGSYIFSVGSFGCNFRCKFCQNWQIAQITEVPTEVVNPSELVQIAKSQKGNIGIAFTYNEPSIWYEYVYDVVKISKKEGLKTVLVTNGFIEEQPLREILPYIDAMNIDLKAFKEDFYRDTLGRLSNVLKTIEICKNYCHVEITTLLIPGLNDEEEEIEQLAKWLSSVDKKIPLHFSRYFPNYKLNIPPTPIEKVKKARLIAKKYLYYVYTGNIDDEEGSTTYCKRCGEPLIKRNYYNVKKLIKGKVCEKCKEKLDIVI
ncbi:MAG: AmmeMemoRadiSam system radical SAM enzyme [Thermovenabulum sp.]|uniref:AmmeMemoRadiSam system radical SAM enzyme n=1 Tax=Thermovenabulum sp. TaxID=3100335 RepID=UPI003C7E7F37